MFIWLGFLLSMIAMLFRIVGGIALVGTLFYGIYILFVKSIMIGLMMIGAAVVGGWVITIISGLIDIAGEVIMVKAAEAHIEDEE